MFKNEHDKNKRIFPIPYVKPKSAPIALPPADNGTTGGKGSRQDGWESVDGVVEGPVQAVIAIGTKVKSKLGNLGYIGTVKSFVSPFYTVEWNKGNNCTGLMQMLRKELVVIDENEGVAASITKAEHLRLVPRRLEPTTRIAWPEGGIAIPSKTDILAVGTRVKCLANSLGQVGTVRGYDGGLWYRVEWDNDIFRSMKRKELEVVPPMVSSNLIYPREDDKPAQPTKKIHSFGLNDDFENTSIDTDVDPVDHNNWGGIEELTDALDATAQAIETEAMIPYGPGNYPSEEDYRTEGFYNTFFNDKEKQPFTWVMPNYLAAGPHPILTSHLDDLSQFKKAGFKAIVTVFDKPLDKKYRDGFQYLFVPTPEGESCDLEQICKFIDIQQMLGHPVFIHSLAGSGRAATVLAAYFMHKNYTNGAEEALGYIREHYHKDAVETTQQEEALLKFGLDS